MTYNEIKTFVLANIDDPSQTSFDDAKMTSILRAAMQHVENKMTVFNKFRITSIISVSISADVNGYTLTHADDQTGNETLIKKVLQVHRTDSDRREQGTIINESQKDNYSPMWNCPVVYIKFEQDTDTGDYRYRLYFAQHGLPDTSQTLSITVADVFSRFSNLNELIIHIFPELYHLLITKATVIALGGEKNVDQFWMSQYMEAEQTAEEFLGAPQQGEEPEFIRVIDGGY